MPPALSRSSALLALCAYAALIAYGSLYPFSGWQANADTWSFLDFGLHHRPLSFPDLVVNALIYIPMGLLLRCARPGMSNARSAMLAMLIGGLLSLCVESAQAHLPQRVPALSDLLLNTAGAVAGALLYGPLAADGWLMRWFARWRTPRFQRGTTSDLLLIAFGGWALSQLSPFVPSLDLGLVRNGLKPLAVFFDDPARFAGIRALTYGLEIGALALLARDARLPGTSITRTLWLFVIGVLVLKGFIVSRQVSAEALTGAAAGLILALASPRVLKPLRPPISALALVLAAILSELSPESGPLRSLNLVPFVAHMTQPMLGISVLLDSAWYYLALALALHRCGTMAANAQGLVIVVFCTAFAFILEWLQQQIPGRTPDITSVAIALIAAGVTSRRLALDSMMPRPRSTARLAATLLTSCVCATVAGAWAMTRPSPVVAATSADKAMLPAPETMRKPPPIPGFKIAHPRLPHPDDSERMRIRSTNIGYVHQLLARAKSGQGDLNAAIQAEVLEPGSQDVRLIIERVLRLKPTWRGHEQTKPIALAYDWLHAQVPPDLMPKLKDKVVEACEYQIHVIRTERLSPYNVYLYNSPLQALMACALAIYRDDPRADPVMAFTHDYWINRVLPVWRQIGGRNGGWHEGGEYVGIGIGQAIYQLPAMWRSATAQDLFRDEPAIRGFTDFLLHRLRPDGTPERWGDGRHPRRGVPDAIALAIEYRNSAAYSVFAGESPRIEPTAWPWGPLPERSLFDPAARSRLPLVHVADGIGWVFARNNWRPDATFITFKAGDNFWSHSHLDQGSFTLFKGSALALDSGCYCGYGKDHHLNYQYQTIAHNTITVTDPLDTQPMPSRNNQPPRMIANDGGQRRVGSGWDLHPAPLDIEDWQRKHEDFHTGRLVKLVEADDLLIALTDITPAYTNTESGSGRFHARTRRVERAWRIFIYDRVSDLFVVYDNVESTEPEFLKRWLLHSALSPHIEGSRFVIERPAATKGADTGRLEGDVLLPRDAQLVNIGGPGFEFFIDGRNFDENGSLAANIARGPAELDPGAWRLEVTPSLPARSDRFLVVMRPVLGDAPPVRTQASEDESSVVARVSLPGRDIALRIPHEQLAVELTLTTSAGKRTHRVEGVSERVTPRGWMQGLKSLLSIR